MDSVRLLSSPWADTFRSLVSKAKREMLIVSPFISGAPIRELAERLAPVDGLRGELLTSFTPTNLAEGLTNPAAILDFCREVPNSAVTHLSNLHAKVYVVDNQIAVVTSSNLTNGGLWNNHEYGIWIEDPRIVHKISLDVRHYASLGSGVSVSELRELARISTELQGQRNLIQKSAREALRIEFQQQLAKTKELLRQIRAKPGDTTNAIFSRTILYLLRNGPLSTEELHPLIQEIHPDLCDDRTYRVINGVKFGREWKHRVRSAQQSLKRTGQVDLTRGRWSLLDGALEASS